MLTPHMIPATGYGHYLPLIDLEFDHFELNTELEETLRDTETANFYHNALDHDE